MDLDEVKACIRALVSSTAFSYRLNNLLNDFKNMTGLDLPLFECLHPVDFLRTLKDTVELFGDPHNPEIALIKSNKSAHIISLVDRQKTKNTNIKNPHLITKQKRLVIPNKNESVTSSRKSEFVRSDSSLCRNVKKTTSSQPSLLAEVPSFNNDLRNASHFPKTYTFNNASKQPKSISPVSDVKVDPIRLLKINNYSNEISSSTRSHESTAGAHETNESPEIEKTDSSYFEDVSDNETSLSIEDSRSSSGQALSASCCFVNDGIKNKLKKIIQNYPKGLWCCELPDLFLEKFDFVLDYREFGYTSLIQMLSELPDVFRCVRPGNEDWILFDASTPPSLEEKKMMDVQLTGGIYCSVRENILRLLFNYLENSSDSGIEMDKILDLYQKMFGSSLDLQALGFKDVKSLLEIWDGSLLNFLRINGKIIVVPISKLTSGPAKRWEEALPPITPESDIFAEIFPKDVVGPDESLPKLDLTRLIAVGQVVEVCVAEVWSPSKFYLQLNNFKSRLNQFMDDLQKFYNVHLNKYKMPDSTIRPNQVCVGLYNSDPDFPDEWHRAQIIKVINKKLVLVSLVDFGTMTRMKKSQLRFMHRNFHSLPIQSFPAELWGVASPNDENRWPMSTSKKFLESLRVPYLDAEMVDIDFKKPFTSVILFDSFHKSVISINKKFILEKLARVKEPEFEKPLLMEKVFESKAKDSKPPNNQTKVFSGNSSGVWVQESLDKNLPEITDEFSDIADLSPTSSFFLKMKCLKPENSRTSQAKSEPRQTSEFSYEFEEVPDLEENDRGKKIDKTRGEEENAQADATESKMSSESAPPFLEEIRFPSSLPELEKESLNSAFPSPETTIFEKNSFLLRKSKRLPPGLEHMNMLSNFNQVQPDDLRKKINILAMELLSTSPSIKQVGVTDPVLAMKIATEMAEAYISSEYSSKLPFCFNPHLANSFMKEVIQNDYEEMESNVPVVPVFPVVSPPCAVSAIETPDIISSEESSTKPQPAAKATLNEKNENEFVRNIKIGGKNIHLVLMDDRYYFCAEEIVRTFTLISNREIADRVLHIKKIYVDYKIITKKTDEKALNALKSSGLPTIKNKSKKLKIYLIPLSSVMRFLQALGCQTMSFEKEFFELIKTEKEKMNPNKLEIS